MRRLVVAAALSFVIVVPSLRAGPERDWLAARQRADGSWKPGLDYGAPATTALVVLDLVRREKATADVRAALFEALAHLRRIEDASGAFPGGAAGHEVRDHAVVTLALTEVNRVRVGVGRPARLALARLLALRQGGAWSAGTTGDPDLEATTWAALAIETARLGRLDVPDTALEGVRAFLERAPTKTPEDRAMATLLRLVLGDPVDRKAIDALVRDAEEGGAPRFWHFATLAFGRLDEVTQRAYGAVLAKRTRASTNDAAAVALSERLVVAPPPKEISAPTRASGGGGGGHRGQYRGPYGQVPPNLRKPEDPPPPPDNATPTAPPSTGGTREPNDRPYGDTFFEHHGVNPFIDTEDDAKSTFAMDVDTGSYTIARRFLHDGHLPDPASVRVEEFVNAFAPADAPPTEGTFRLVAEGGASPFGGPRYHLLRLGVRAKVITAAERKPARLTFVVDVSGSMNRENRLGLVKRALLLLVASLRETDSIALVVYGSAGRVVLEHTRNHDAILDAIDALRADGSTNAEEGLVLGYREARKAFAKDAINRVILCSDGVANVGRTGPDSILAAIGDAARDGIALTTVGFGMGNYNDVLMEKLADRGNGQYAYVDRLSEAKRIFVDELEGTLQTVAYDAKIQVELDPKTVARFRLLGYENRRLKHEEFRKDDVDAGEVGAGHAVTALYELKLRPDAKRDRLGIFKIRYRAPDRERVVEEAIPIDRALFEAKPSLAFRRCAAVAELAELMRKSYWARDGSYGRVIEYLEPLVEASDHDPRLVELLEVARTAQRLSGDGRTE